ncbi:hypothetical protein FSP39_019184 [Pinctada imbricata]|uniref:Uncharacterized protein n=1 Tax=Pinctada imbricata TaxID=66713 RepID=A0AA88XPW2_PINIB|nr:hypothetical protein FSP39_019184 [Pinctada imbricata]
MSATRQLAELHSMMGNYRDAIMLYEEIQECLRGETPVEVLLDLLKNYEKGKDFDNAILLLNLMMVSEDTRSSIDNKRYIGLHIGAWEFNVKQNQKEMATQYLLDAFTFAGQNMPRKDNVKDKIKAYILCSCDETTCSIGENIKMNLNSLCGIPSLHNTKDCLPGTRRLRYLEESLDNCEFILLINNCEFTSEFSNFYMELVISSDVFRSKAVLIGNAEMDPQLRMLQRVAFPETNDVTIGWLKDLFEKVLLGRDLK